MSSKLSGPQRRKLQFSMTNAGSAAELARDDVRAASGLGDRENNIAEARAITDPARQALLATARGVHRDNWRAELLRINGRPINVKSGGWQRMESEIFT